jgi:hypothetical protein
MMSGDFDDITCDYLTEPRLSDIDLPDGWPSTAAIRGFIRASNRWSADTPVPDSLVAAWRQGIIRRAYAMWHARRRKRELRPLVGWTRRQRRALSAMWGLMQEPWFRVGLTVMTGYAAFVCWSAHELLLCPRVFRDFPSAMGSELLRYTHEKAGFQTPAPRQHWDPWDANPWHIAAVNSVSADAVTDIYDRLTAAVESARHRQIDALFARLESVGRGAIAEHGEWLCERDDGPPRGLVPWSPDETEAVRVTHGVDETESVPPHPSPGRGGRPV